MWLAKGDKAVVSRVVYMVPVTKVKSHSHPHTNYVLNYGKKFSDKITFT